MIICTAKADAEGQDTLAVKATPTGYEISNAASGLRFAFDIGQVSFGPDILYLALSPSGGVVKMWASETTNSRDGQSAALSRQYAQAAAPFCAIAIEPNKADYHLVSLRPVITAVSAVIVDTGASSTDRLLYRNATAMRAFITRMWAKSRLLAQTNTQDSLAALELQLDMLSAVVQAHLAGETMAWSDSFFAAVASSSSLTLTAPAAAVVKVGAFKAALRTVQAVYFKAIGRG